MPKRGFLTIIKSVEIGIKTLVSIRLLGLDFINKK